MVKLAVSALLVAGLLLAPQAGADPDILTPYCTGGQVPEAGECKPAPGEVYVDDTPGANPEVPLGLDPENVPAV